MTDARKRDDSRGTHTKQQRRNVQRLKVQGARFNVATRLTGPIICSLPLYPMRYRGNRKKSTLTTHQNNAISRPSDSLETSSPDEVASRPRCGGGPEHESATFCKVCGTFDAYDEKRLRERYIETNVTHGIDVFHPARETATARYIKEHRNAMFLAATATVNELDKWGGDAPQFDETGHGSFSGTEDFCDMIVGKHAPWPVNQPDVDETFVRAAYMDLVVFAFFRRAIARNCPPDDDDYDYELEGEYMVFAEPLFYALEHAEEYGLKPSDILQVVREPEASI